MARIPVVEPGATQLRTTSPTAPMTRIGTAGEALQIAGETLQKTAGFLYQKMDEARNYTEATQSELYMTKLSSDALTKLETDTYTDPMGKVRFKTGARKEDYAPYDEMFRQGRQEISKMVTNREQLPKILAAYDKNYLVTRNAIGRKFRDNMISEGKIGTLEFIDGLSNAYAIKGDPMYLKMIEGAINEATKYGFFDPKEAYNLKKTVIKDTKEIGIRSGIAINAIATKDKLLQGDYQLSADETAKWVEVADKQIERNKRIAEEAKERKWLENGGNIIENLEATSVVDIIQAMKRDDIDPDFGNRLIVWKTNPKDVKETNKEIWLKLAKDSVSPEQDLREFQRALAKAVADDNIQAGEAASLSVQVKSLYDSAIKFKTQSNRFNQLIGATMDAFNNWSNIATTNPTTMAFNMAKELFKKIHDGVIKEENIEDESRKILDDAKKVINSNYNQYKIGDIVTNSKTGKNYKVTGYDIDGEPLVDEIK